MIIDNLSTLDMLDILPRNENVANDDSNGSKKAIPLHVNDKLSVFIRELITASNWIRRQR